MQPYEFNSKAINRLLIVILTISSLSLTISCQKEDTRPDVDAEGLTQEIRNIVPDSILNVVKSMGMPIFGGNTPPTVNQRLNKRDLLR